VEDLPKTINFSLKPLNCLSTSPTSLHALRSFYKIIPKAFVFYQGILQFFHKKSPSEAKSLGD
jgi:hypothetical protein